MSWTMGNAPLGHRPAGQFNREIELDGLLYVEPSPKWFRGRLGGEVVVDSRHASVVHQHGRLPRLLFPPDDVRMDLLRPSDRRETDPAMGEQSFFSLGDKEDAAWTFTGEPLVEGLIGFEFHALDEWLEEDERLFGHARDPYSRIDVRRSSRHVRVLINGEPIADSRRAKALFEAGLPTRWYLPREDVRLDLLTPSDTRTTCAYKGLADHFSFGEHDDVAWTYEDPLHDALEVKGRIGFYNERVDLEIDGEVEERPQTPWSR